MEANNDTDGNASDINATNIDNQSFSGSTRRKIDLAWRYISLNIENGKPMYTCLFCLNNYMGGRINRMKQHLARKIRNIARCRKVLHAVKEQMAKILEEIKKSKDIYMSFGDEIEEEELTPSHPPSKK